MQPFKRALACLGLAIPLAIFGAGDAAYAATTTCNTVAACVFGQNVGTSNVSRQDYGVEGTSKSNHGVVGVTFYNSTAAGFGKAGVVGYDGSTNKNVFNAGVYGTSSAAVGVKGKSNSNAGVEGISTTGTGVSGISISGTGVLATGSSTGLSAFQNAGCAALDQNSCTAFVTGAALAAGTAYGGLGLSIQTDTGNTIGLINDGVGATITSGTEGLQIVPDTAGNGHAGLVIIGDTSPRDNASQSVGAIVQAINGISATGSETGVAASGSTAFYASGPTLFEGVDASNNDVAVLDNAGNLTIKGKLTQKGLAATLLPNADGSTSSSYSVNAAVPTIEDMGEAVLNSGTAFVHMSPALAKGIDASRGYLVFLTPQGETKGLYVVNKSAQGFSVRETGGARDSIAFDYRIVAHPYFTNSSARATPLLASTKGKRFYRHLQPLRFVNGKLDVKSLPHPTD